MINHIKKIHFENYHNSSEKVYFSPGRVNIIGGHTDYNGGHVLPFCIDKGIYCGVSKNGLSSIRIFSENFFHAGIIEIDLNNLSYTLTDTFSDYLLGVIKELTNMEKELLYGLDISLSSNLPVGGGLSSSAALSVLLFKIFSVEFNFGLEKERIAHLAKTVENSFIGVNCGIMDQFIISVGKAQHALFLNTKNMNYEYIYLDMKDHMFILINSNIKRKLTESKYNVRQSETREVLKILKENFEIDHLCDISAEDLNVYLEFIHDKTLQKRLIHVVTENLRVIETKEAFQKNDFIKIGQLLFQAHESAKNNYCISSEILDDLVEIAISSKALGAKMIGGGFGGSILALIRKDNYEHFIDIFGQKYQEKYSSKFIYSIIEAKDGVKQID